MGIVIVHGTQDTAFWGRQSSLFQLNRFSAACEPFVVRGWWCQPYTMRPLRTMRVYP